MVTPRKPRGATTKPFVRVSQQLTDACQVSHFTLDMLPGDVIQRIADSFLSPKDRLNLSSCNRHLRACLPKPLAIEIVNIDGSQRLEQRFFVSPFKAECNLQHTDEKGCYCQHDMLYSHESLHYGQEYIFWNFDYFRNDAPVYLGRHSLHDYQGVVSPERLSRYDTADGEPVECFTIALRQGIPLQTWQVVGNSLFVSPGDPVVWEDVVGLMVCGKNPIQGCHQDSMVHSILSCFPGDPVTSLQNWMALRSVTLGQTGEFRENSEWGLFEKVRLRLCTMHRDTVPPNPRMRVQSLVMATTPAVSQLGRVFLYVPGQDIGETHAIGDNGVVPFHFWIDCGVMYFQATNLSVSVAIPILKEDGGNYYSGQDEPSWGVRAMQALLDAGSARWSIIKHYLVVAADEIAGVFYHDKDAMMMRQYKQYHSKYLVEYRESSQTIHVDVKGGKIRDMTDDGAPLSIHFREHQSKWLFVFTG